MSQAANEFIEFMPPAAEDVLMGMFDPPRVEDDVVMDEEDDRTVEKNDKEVTENRKNYLVGTVAHEWKDYGKHQTYWDETTSEFPE